MRKKILIVLSVMLSVNVFSLKAYDFKEGGLFYKKTASGEVEVVSETAVFSPLGYYNDGNAPTGRVVVPEEVRHGAVNYRVTSIHELAFNYCSELTFISIPGSVKTITKSTFFSSGLTGISIAEGVEKIEKHAFYFCSKLTSVSIPNSVTALDNFAFGYCEALASVSLGKGITKISQALFSECKNLSSVTIPESITSIDANAFANCNKLKNIKVKWDTPPAIDASVFSGLTLGDITLTVPAGKGQAYKAAAVWQNFVVKEEPMLNVTINSLNMLATGETKAIAIVSNTDWTVASNQTWLKVSPHKGNKNGSVNATAEANTSLAAREAEITIVAENLTHRIAVTQAAGAATLTVTPATLSFVAAGEGKTLAVKSNTSWTVESNQSWLSLSATSGSGDQNLTASASANTTVAQRTATITLKVGSSLVKTVSVTQAAGTATLTVTPATLNFVATGEGKAFAVKSNTSWTAESNQSWLSLSAASGSGDQNLTASASEANTENKVRTATVTIVVGGIRKEITVKQDAATSAADFEALGLRLWSSQGVLFVQSDSVIGEAEVFHLSGLLVTSLKLSEGITQIALPKGLYVVRFNNKLAKVMVQ